MISVVFSPAVSIPVLSVVGSVATLAALYSLAQKARGALFRLVTLAFLLIIISNPQVVREDLKPIDDIAIVIVDSSNSQAVGHRQHQTQETIKKLGVSLKQLRNLEVRIVAVGSNEKSGTIEEETRLFEALSQSTADIAPQRLAGIVMITDGLVHDIPSLDRAKNISVPLHILLTGEKNEQDRRLLVERAPDYGLVGSRIPVLVRAEDNGVPHGAPVPVTLRRNGGDSRNLHLRAGISSEIEVTIDRSGPNIYEIAAAVRRDELSDRNNNTVITVNGIRDRLRVLLISGQPHLGERAWRNLLKSDPNVDLVHFTILRPLSKDDGTPLNELALISFPIRELFEEQLGDFDVVIFDRYSRRGLVPYQFMLNITSYVQDGGAVLLSVGPEYADAFTLFDSPLQNILPAAPTGKVFEEAFLPAISPIGLRHPVTMHLMKGNTNQAKPSWGRWLRQVDVAANKGNELMTGYGGQPLLLLDRVGNGRVALLLSDTMWLWGKGFEGGGPQAEMLRRLVHWLMREPDLEEEALLANARGSSLVITRRSLEPNERPVEITFPSGRIVNVTPQEQGNGVAHGTLPVTELGLYRIGDGQHTTVVALGNPNPLETYDVISTADRLTPIAELTGGSIIWLSENGLPAVRKIRPERSAFGRNWIGFRSNRGHMVAGIKQFPLIPTAIALILLVGSLMLTWWREGN